MPLKIDYLTLDRLAKMFSVATDYSMFSHDNFIELLEKARDDRLDTLCRNMENGAG